MIPNNKLLSNDVQQQQQQDNSNEAENDNNNLASASASASSSTKTSFKTNQSQSIIEQAQRFKEEGNVLFTKRDFEASLVSYQRSLSMLVSSITKEDEDDQRHQQQVIQLNIAVKNNIILVFHKLGRNLEALNLCNELLLLQDEKNGFLYVNYSKCKFFFIWISFWDLVFQLFREFFLIYGFIS